MTKGSQRLSLKQLQAWENLGYGMFIHFGMSTFDGKEFSNGDKPSTFYSPEKLDVDQWVSVARDAGMKYAVLTTKHVSGHCLWPSKFTDYHIGTSSHKTDVAKEFVKACEKHHILPGFYYCSCDYHHLMGSRPPSHELDDDGMFTTEQYREFQFNQINELMTEYGKIGEVWIDIPILLPRDYRHMLYEHIAGLQPDAVIIMNHGVGDGTDFSLSKAWPTDAVTVERFLPNSHTGYPKWRNIEGQTYYLPGEVCDPIGHEWFYVEGDNPRSDEELLGMYLVSRSRGTNLLLDVPPDKHGLIPKTSVDALMRLHRHIEKFSIENKTDALSI